MNEHYRVRYELFINQRRDRTLPDGYVERHHILPRSLFPDLINDQNNLIYLTAREHYLAHWMLAKMFGGKMWFAFNQMKRVAKGKGSALYEKGRTYIVELSRELNVGRVHSEEMKQKLSNCTKNTVVVRDDSGNCFRTSKEDSRYVSGQLKFYRVGSKHKESTKQKMRNASIRGKTAINNGFSWMFIDPSETTPEGWELGLPKQFGENVSERFVDSSFYYNPETGEQRRSKEPIEGFVLGRKEGFQQGLSKMNSMDRVYDISSGTRYMTDSPLTEYQTKVANNSVCVQIGILLFESSDLFRKTFEYINLESEIVQPYKGGRLSKTSKLFREKFNFTSLSDLGIIICRIDTWSGNVNEIKLVRKDNVECYRTIIDEYRRSHLGATTV